MEQKREQEMAVEEQQQQHEQVEDMQQGPTQSNNFRSVFHSLSLTPNFRFWDFDFFFFNKEKGTKISLFSFNPCRMLFKFQYLIWVFSISSDYHSFTMLFDWL